VILALLLSEPVSLLYFPVLLEIQVVIFEEIVNFTCLLSSLVSNKILIYLLKEEKMQHDFGSLQIIEFVSMPC
jgi:hypothetical protein